MSDMGLPKRGAFDAPTDQRRFVADDEPPDNAIAKYVDGSLTTPKAPTQVQGKKPRKTRSRKLESPDVFIVAQLQAYLLQQQGQEARDDAAVQPPG